MQSNLHVSGSPVASKGLQWEFVADCFHSCLVFYSFFFNYTPTVCQTHPLLGISESPTYAEGAFEDWQKEALTQREWPAARREGAV